MVPAQLNDRALRRRQGQTNKRVNIGSFDKKNSKLSYFPQRLVHPLLPYAIMGGNALLAGLLCMTLPETKGMPTAETMDSEEDAKESIELQVWGHLQEIVFGYGNV